MWTWSDESASPFDNLPTELTTRSQWVVYRLEDHGKPKLDKVPYTPRGGYAKSNDPRTWGTFAEALAAYQHGSYSGIGFVFNESDPFVGVDLDSCRDPETGQLEPWAAEIVRALDSYTEASPSGAGVHIIVKGTLPPTGRKKGKFETYNSGRFFTMTGEHIGGTLTTIEDRTVELENLHARIFGISANGSVSEEQLKTRSDGSGSSLTDEEIITLAQRAKNRERFTPLWIGDWSGYPSQSEADQALCNLLSFYCGPDPVQIDRLFRQSKLYREKWDKKHFSDGKTYGEATIEKALTSAREFYRPGVPWPDDGDAPMQEAQCDFQSQRSESAWSEENARYTRREQEPENRETVNDVSESWPVLSKEALCGLPGDLVRTIDPHTEADPVAVLVTLLVMFGNVINASAYFLVEYTKHFPRLFVALVGRTAKGRKGISLSTLLRCFQNVDPDWTEKRISGGLSSGEGLIMQVRDPRYGVNKDGEPVLVDEGEPDKRFLVIEEELAGPLKIMTREGNSLSAILRQAWERGNLRPLTKNNPIRATGAHISLVGHITQEETGRYVTETEQTNGFANRFSWLLVKRSKVIPNPRGVPEKELQPLIERLRQAVDFARKTTLMQRDADAERLWEQIYPDLSEGKPGLFGAIVARAEAQVMRVACLYALLNRSNVVSVVHLNAALALWEYAESSARIIFGDSTGNPTADDILSALRRNPEGLTRTDIRDLFGRNRRASEIDRSLRLLLKSGLAEKRTERPRGNDGEEIKGRPAERWFATKRATTKTTKTT